MYKFTQKWLGLGNLGNIFWLGCFTVVLYRCISVHS
jgi:hypothetical protein